MTPRVKSSPAARKLIQRFESFRQHAVKEDNAKWIVGYGHRATARENAKVSRDEATLLLIYDVMQAEKAIDEVSSKPLERHQRDALILFEISGFNMKEIASMQNSSVGAVKTKISRGRKLLRQFMEEKGQGRPLANVLKTVQSITL